MLFLVTEYFVFNEVAINTIPFSLFHSGPAFKDIYIYIKRYQIPFSSEHKPSGWELMKP